MAEDYINRSGAINALKGLPTWWADQGGIYGNAQPPMEAMLDPEDAVSAIENIPSADVVEVKHGEWEENSRTSISERHRQIHYSIYKCSRCNHANGRFKSNFCPNCGARMDGGT